MKAMPAARGMAQVHFRHAPKAPRIEEMMAGRTTARRISCGVGTGLFYAFDSDHEFDLVANNGSEAFHIEVGAFDGENRFQTNAMSAGEIALADDFDGDFDRFRDAMKGEIAGDFEEVAFAFFDGGAFEINGGILFGVEEVGAFKVGIPLFLVGIDVVDLEFEGEGIFGGVGFVDGEIAGGVVDSAIDNAEVGVTDAENDRGVNRVDFIRVGGAGLRCKSDEENQ